MRGVPAVKVQKLIDLLSEYSLEAEVRLCTQPRDPLESAVAGVVGESEIRDHEGRDLGDAPEVVYLLEGAQLGYGRSVAWEAEAAGW
jgi:hypothetical protein